MAFADGPLELLIRRSPKWLIGGIKKRCVLMTGFAGIIAVDAFRALIPGNDPRVGIQQEECIIPHPGWNDVRLGGIRLITQHEEVARRQHIRFRGVLDFPRTSVRAKKLEGAHLLALFEEGLPTLQNYPLHSGRREIIRSEEHTSEL